jgi:hypothetical protein
MSIIPLDVQRRCERRWAARFGRQAPEAPSKKREAGSKVRRAPKAKGKAATAAKVR